MTLKKSSKNKDNRIKPFRALLAMILCLMVTAVFVPFMGGHKAEAETVTDTLTIKLGYWGMKEEDYVEKATYHWTELQSNLNIVTEDYSFFKGKENGSYSIVVASGTGFYLSDLLSYAGVNVSDIQNITFYTNDYSAGAFTSFTPYQLLSEPRYYYDNLAAHITNRYNDAGVLVGYDVEDGAESNKRQVRTMLALESNWAEYEAGTQNTNPNHTSMSTSSRFRLLFGQNSVDEGKTNQSAKYVHTVALTIPGSPSVKGGDKAGNGKIVLSNKLGKHRARFSVASDEAMLNKIMERLTWSSTDETILKINNVSMKTSTSYNDAVDVVLDYEVLKEGGDASIKGDFMGMDLSGSTIVTGDNPTNDIDTEDSDEDSDEQKPGAGDGDGDSDESGDGDAGKKSLVEKGGVVSKSKSGSTGEGGTGNNLYAMDINDIMDPDVEETNIVRRDHTSEYIPGLCIGTGGMLLLGGASSSLQFRSQMGRSIFRRRKP